MGPVTDTRASGQEPNAFQFHGKVYYTQGPLDAVSDDAKYTHLFVHDPAYAVGLRHYLTVPCSAICLRCSKT